MVVFYKTWEHRVINNAFKNFATDCLSVVANALFVVFTFLEDVISNAKKRPRDKNFFIGLSIDKCYITKMASTARQIDGKKGRNMNYVS